MTWDEVKDLAPLYAIGALDLKAAQAVEDFLRSATQQQKSEFAEWSEVAALLPAILPQLEVPSHLKGLLLTRIAANEFTNLSSHLESATKVLPFQPKRPSTAQTPRWLLLAATIALAFTSAFLGWQNSKLSDRLGTAQSQLDDLLSPYTRIISMKGVEIPDANAKVVWDTRTQTWKVFVHDLPAPPSDRDYQLWYVTKDAKINAALFRTNEKGDRELSLTLPPEALNGLAATAVTLEPKGGSPQPTGKFYLMATI
ncbi:MAG: anti-sigma factor [Blastocatellia bacterium]